MRIAYFANSRIPSDQANTVHVVNMASALGSLGHEVTLWVYRGGGDVVSRVGEIAGAFGVPATFQLRHFPEFHLPGRSTLASGIAAFRERVKGVDVVIGRQAKACSCAALIGLPTVFEIHQPIAALAGVERLLLKRALKSRAFRGVITISKPLAALLQEEFGAAGPPMLVAADAAAPMDHIVPVRLGAPHRPQIGYVGQLYAGRGVDLIIELARRIPDADFQVIGGLEADVDHHRRSGNLPGNIFFVGHVSPAVAASLRAGCDILLAPYQPDATVPGGQVTSQWMSPLKIFEYMASRCAFIASDLPVLHEVLAHGRNCLLVPPRDIDMWERSMRHLLKDEAFRGEIARAAYEDFERNHTWVSRARKILKFAVERVRS